jgi:hypothetical protein
MSAKNISSEKIDSSGFQSGGYNGGNATGKHTPKKAIIEAVKDGPDSALPKGKVGAGKESKNTAAWKG